jgi:hypothetical protein
VALTVKKSTRGSLVVGDSITVAVTHEVKIDRESAWIKYEATTNIQENETAEEAKARIGEHVTSSVVEMAYLAAEQVQRGEKAVRKL